MPVCPIDASLPAVPRSKGCLTCVARKTRCGRLAPASLILLPTFCKNLTLSSRCRWPAADVPRLRDLAAGLRRIPEAGGLPE